MRFAFFLSFLFYGVISDENLTIADNIAGMDSLSSLLAILSTKGYEPVLTALNGSGNFTLFAPNNKGIKAAGLDVSKIAFVTEILNYHTLENAMFSTDLKDVNFLESLAKDSEWVDLGGKGQVIFAVKHKKEINIYFSNLTAKVVMVDVNCSNGVMHVIDNVITLPPNATDAIKWSGLGMMMESLVKTNLNDTVDTTAGVTVFAPTNDAFKAAGIDPEKADVDVLTNILKYHVVSSTTYTTDIVENKTLTTLQGGDVTLHVTAAHYQVNNANITVPDVLVKNGVIHFIDTVLVPPNTTK